MNLLVVLIAATALCQTQAERQFQVMAAFSDRALMRAPEREVERSIPIDGGESVELTFFVNSRSAEITLIDPAGAIHPPGIAIAPVDESSKGQALQYSLVRPAAGLWKYRVREGEEYLGYRAISLTGISSSNLVAALLGANRELAAGRPIGLGFLLRDSDGPVLPGEITSLKSAFARGDSAPVEVRWADDGQSLDGAANDGVYGARITLPEPGDYAIVVEVEGRRGGRPFRRTVAGKLRAISGCGALDREYRSTLLDTDGNGRADALELGFRVEASRAGTIEVTAQLMTAAGTVLSTSTRQEVAAGGVELRAPLALSDVRAAGATRYELAVVTLACVSAGEVVVGDEQYDLGTVEVDLTNADRPPVLLTGRIADRGVDSNGNGKFDQLEALVGVNVSKAGQYVFSAGLTDRRGTVLESVAGEAALREGAQDLRLTFDGARIGANGQDGPYRILAFSVFGAGDSTEASDLGQTQSYRYLSFEGAAAPAEPGIEVTPASLDFGDVTSGQSRDLALNVRNPGLAALEIRAVTSSNASVSIATRLPLTVSPGARQALTVRFQPQTTGRQTGTLTLISNDPVNPAVTVPFSANGVPPGVAAGRLSVSPATLDFGTVTMGLSRQLALTLRNYGDGPVTVRSMAASSPMYAISVPLPFTVAAGEDRAVAVRFTPSAAGPATAILSVESSDASTPIATVALTGTGVAETAAGGTLSLGSSPLDFGSLRVGQVRDQILNLRASGGAVTVSAVELSGAEFRVVSPAAPFTVLSSTDLVVRFKPRRDGATTAGLRLEYGRATLTETLRGAGTAVPALTSFTDAFERAGSAPCVLGRADLAMGGSGSHYYLPLFPGPAGAAIVDGSLQNRGEDFGGVQFASSSTPCSGRSAENLGQNLYLSADVMLNSNDPARITQAGPFFRARSAAPGDGIIGGQNTGYWVQLWSNGEVRVKNLATGTYLATSMARAGFDGTKVHRLEVSLQGLSLEVQLDGTPVMFPAASGVAAAVTLASGTNDGAAGIAFSAETNRGRAGGQRVDDLVVMRLP
ncbi:MAG: choice-of-anchor D domain-containing protein [Bryobacteraceae bacterium]|nr:choice-of-anchor D domain-containing protein [Bryobacteraceae bacterium]